MAGGRVHLGDGLEAFDRAMLSAVDLCAMAKHAVGDYYLQLREQDQKINKLVLGVIFLVILFNSPVSTLFLVPVGMIGRIHKESLLAQVQKIEWIWTETKSLRNVCIFAGCIAAYQNFWYTMGLGFGAYLGEAWVNLQPRVVPPPPAPVADQPQNP